MVVVVVLLRLLLQGRRPAAAGRRVHAQERRHGRVVAVALRARQRTRGRRGPRRPRTAPARTRL